MVIRNSGRTDATNDDFIKELGARLKSIREAQGLTIADVTDRTKIQKRFLSAIEEGELDKLPRGPYIRSFVRQYCEYLSAPDLWNTYDSLMKDPKNAAMRTQSPEGQEFAMPPKVFKPASYWWIYFIVIISVGAAGWITWKYRGDLSGLATNPMDGGTAAIVASRDASPDLPQAPGIPASSDTAASGDAVDLSWMDGKPQQTKPSSQSVPVRSADEQPAAALNITASGTVWLKVSQGGKVFFEGIMKSPESKSFEIGAGGTPIRVRYGNPGRTSASWAGVTADPVQTGSAPVTRYYWPDGTVTDKLK